MKTTFKTLAGVALMGMSAASLALPLTGEVSFSNDSDAAFKVDRDDKKLLFGDAPNAEVDGVAGDFSNYFASGNLATFFDFSYDPFTSPSPLWEAETLNDGLMSFEFTRLDILDERPGNLYLSGLGNLMLGGETKATNFDFSASGRTTVSWSAANQVPEPATLALLGLGLVGLGVSRRRSQQGETTAA